MRYIIIIIIIIGENDQGELQPPEFGSTPFGTVRDFYYGEGGSNNVFNMSSTSTGINLNFEQHASVSPIEEFGLNAAGFKIVDVAQKLKINYNSSNRNLSVDAHTNIFPSATLNVSGNGNTSTLMQYNQPSFPGTHSAPVNGATHHVFIKEINMFKINLINSFLYLIMKYIIFFSVIAFIGDRFKNIVLNHAETSSEMIKLTLNYILYVSIYIMPLMMVFIFPLYFIMKIKRGIYFLVSIMSLFIVEYCFYTYLYASSDKILGIYNIMISVILLWLFFYKAIRLKFISTEN